MKRLLLILIALPLMAAEPEGEWKPIKGEWKQPTKTSWQTNSGTLSFAALEESDKPIRLTGNICIISWESPGPSYIAIVWGNKEKRQSIQIGRNVVSVGPWCGKNRVLYSWATPTKRRIGIALQIDTNSLVGSIGGKKIKYDLLLNRSLPIEIMMEKTNAILSDLSVR